LSHHPLLTCKILVLSRSSAKMPPALSDDDQSDAGDFAVPVRGPVLPEKFDDDEDDDGGVEHDIDAINGDDADSRVKSENEDDEDDEDEDEDEEEFVVEAIKKHMVDDRGEIKFQVKWEGYDKKADLTWEPEENLAETADEILQEYFDRIGGREAIFEETGKAQKGKKRNRQSGANQNSGTKRSKKNESHPENTTPPASKKKWSPPSGSWEDEIEFIDACEDEGSGKLVVYLNWKNGQKTKHDTTIIYKKCPQKMLQFYEKHVKIIREENKNLAHENELGA
jgi:chromobox protein 1